MGVEHWGVTVVAVNGPRGADGRSHSLSRRLALEGLAGMESQLALSTSHSKSLDEVGTVAVGEGCRSWGRRWLLNEGLLGCTRLTELKDAATDGATVHSRGLTRRGLSCWRVDDDRLDSVVGCGVHLLPRVLRGDCSLEPQLQLGLGGTDESLEDMRILGIEGDVAASGVGEALEDGSLLGFEVQTVAELRRGRSSGQR